jgi:hypothetical protein
VPAHDEHGVRSSHHARITRFGGVCPLLAGHTHANRGGRGRIPDPAADLNLVTGTVARVARAGRSALTGPAELRFRRFAGLSARRLVLAVAPAPAPAVLVPPLPARDTDHAPNPAPPAADYPRHAASPRSRFPPRPCLPAVPFPRGPVSARSRFLRRPASARSRFLRRPASARSRFRAVPFPARAVCGSAAEGNSAITYSGRSRSCPETASGQDGSCPGKSGAVLVPPRNVSRGDGAGYGAMPEAARILAGPRDRLAGAMPVPPRSEIAPYRGSPGTAPIGAAAWPVVRRRGQ